MTHNDALHLLAEIHKNKSYRPDEYDRKFLEDLSFYATIGSIQISEKQSKRLQLLYRASQGG